MATRQRIQHLKTSGTTAPSSDILLEGEIAVGMNSTAPRLYIKNTDNKVVEFADKSYVDAFDSRIESIETLIGDEELTTSSKTITESINELKEGQGNMLTDSMIETLWNLLKIATYKDSGVTATMSAFTQAWGIILSTLTGITATYNGEGVPDGTLVSSLSDISVTALYEDGSTKELSGGYTLSPEEICSSANTVTASYKDFTSSFNVETYVTLADDFETESGSPLAVSIGKLVIDDNHYFSCDYDISQCGDIRGYAAFCLGADNLTAWKTGHLYLYPQEVDGVMTDRYQAIGTTVINQDVPVSAMDLSHVNIKIKKKGIYINDTQFAIKQGTTPITTYEGTIWTNFLDTIANNVCYIGTGPINDTLTPNRYPVTKYSNIRYYTIKA